MSVSQPDGALLPTVEEVRRRVRALRAEDIDGWVRECDAHIQQAERDGDSAKVVELCMLAAAGMDGHGRFDEALARIDFGLREANDWSQRAELWLVQATIFATAGDLDAARASRARAERSPERPQQSEPIVLAVYRSVLDSITLASQSVEAAHRAVAETQRAGTDRMASGLVAWLVPWLAARGLASGAMAWVDWLQALSEAVAHRHRREDAAAFRYALTVAQSVEFPPREPPLVGNKYANWRLTLAQLRDALVRADSARAVELVAALDERTAVMNPGFRDGIHVFRALVKAQAGIELTAVPPPKVATLVTLPAWLAGAEAVALGGTRAEAARWRRLLNDALPSWVVTTLEWPASAPRIRALLALRDGDVRAAASLFDAAIEESGHRHAPLEQALAVVQRDELASAGVIGGSRDRDAVTEARASLRAAGVSAAAHAYVAARALAGGVGQSAGPGLTARELEVLSGLAAGRSYREIGERLDVSWRTVQTHAYHIYRKLDVSGRHDAVEEARARRLL